MRYLFLVLISAYSVVLSAQKNVVGEGIKSKPYCYGEVYTFDYFDEDMAVQLRKEFSMRYSNIIILPTQQRIQYHVCGKIDLKTEDKIIRNLLKKHKITPLHVFYSFEPFESKYVCEYPECE